MSNGASSKSSTNRAGILRDIAGIGGVLLAAYGVWLIYVPAAYILGGLTLAGCAVYSAVRGGK